MSGNFWLEKCDVTAAQRDTDKYILYRLTGNSLLGGENIEKMVKLLQIAGRLVLFLVREIIILTCCEHFSGTWAVMQ